MLILVLIAQFKNIKIYHKIQVFNTLCNEYISIILQQGATHLQMDLVKHVVV